MGTLSSPFRNVENKRPFKLSTTLFSAVSAHPANGLAAVDSSTVLFKFSRDFVKELVSVLLQKKEVRNLEHTHFQFVAGAGVAEHAATGR